MSEDKLMKWVYYLVGRCAFSGKYCSRKECPMENYAACIQARDQLKEIVEGHFKEPVTIMDIDVSEYERGLKDAHQAQQKPTVEEKE